MNNGVLEGIDWAQVGDLLGVDKPNTVSKRYQLLKEEFNKLGLPNTSKVGGAKGRATKAAAKPKTANPKARAAVTKSKTPAKGKGKAKPAIKDEEEDEELGEGSAMDEDAASKSDVDLLAENGGNGYQEMEHEEPEEEDA